ncbi:MAG: DNA-binding protein Alba [Candidatus Altiarchaeales archaeon WOR_SM1_86-2]|nr:MAG: DNA-binding protein Alba [Candidatus Altiarchaeales archaeon WOR_SM1_86-2]
MAEKGTKDEDTIFIGKKGVMNYVLAVVTQFNNGANSVLIKARGRAISKAVDVTEVVRRRFIPGSDVTDIKISTEELEGDEGIIPVSAIEITLKK